MEPKRSEPLGHEPEGASSACTRCEALEDITSSTHHNADIPCRLREDDLRTHLDIFRFSAEYKYKFEERQRQNRFIIRAVALHKTLTRLSFSGNNLSNESLV